MTRKDAETPAVSVEFQQKLLEAPNQVQAKAARRQIYEKPFFTSPPVQQY
jgi:hypothetical protein